MFPRTPSSRLKALSRLLEGTGYTGFTHYASTALVLHDHQYHGLGLDAELVSKYGRGRRATVDTILPVRTLVELAEEKVKPRLKEKHVG